MEKRLSWKFFRIEKTTFVIRCDQIDCHSSFFRNFPQVFHHLTRGGLTIKMCIFNFGEGQQEKKVDINRTKELPFLLNDMFF